MPIVAQVTVETTGTMLLGSEIGAALTALEPLGVDLIGLNCATGPAEMSEHLRTLSKHARIPLSVMPNAGLPELGPNGAEYPLTPDELADGAHRVRQRVRARLVGGCCGTTPEHIATLVAAMRDLDAPPRHPRPEPGVSSLYAPVPFRQDTSVLMVGERTNANGSKKFREAMLAEDWEACVAIAREQTREGAHLIDLCVDYVGRDGVADMAELAGRLATASTLPVMLDSTEPEVLRAGLERLGGRSIINSVNFEDGDGPGSRFQRAMELVRTSTARRSSRCASTRRARPAPRSGRSGWPSGSSDDLTAQPRHARVQDIVVDTLTFPITTGQEEVRRDALETIEAIRELKRRHPDVQTTLGVSNVSFGLNAAARQVLNSVFLHECVNAGLDTAIVSAAKILPMAKIPDEQRSVALDLVYDRRREGYDPLSRFMELFEGVSASSAQGRAGRGAGRAAAVRAAGAADRRRRADRARRPTSTRRWSHRPALEIINDTLLAGMKTVGELFGSGQMQLPFVLQSAEVMKAAVAHLEPHMEKTDERGQGHDRARHGQGRRPRHRQEPRRHHPDQQRLHRGQPRHQAADLDDPARPRRSTAPTPIGMSGLLVKSTVIMKENLAGDERPRGRAAPRAARRRRAHPLLRGERPVATSTRAASPTRATRSRACG